MLLTLEAQHAAQLAVGSISAAACFAVILTYLLFPVMRRQRYIELVFYVALNDMIASIGMALGPTSNGSFECWYQGISTTFNFLSVIFWSCAIAWQLYAVVVLQGTIIKRMFWWHVVCWGLPLLLSLLPLTTNTYGNTDDASTWCFVADRAGSPYWSLTFWWIFFYLFLVGGFLLSLYFLASVAWKLHYLRVVPEIMRSTVMKLALYPLVTMGCWSLNIAINIHALRRGSLVFNARWQAINQVALLLTSSQGFWNAVVFFWLNPLVRKQWRLCLEEQWIGLTYTDSDAEDAGMGVGGKGGVGVGAGGCLEKGGAEVGEEMEAGAEVGATEVGAGSFYGSMRGSTRTTIASVRHSQMILNAQLEGLPDYISPTGIGTGGTGIGMGAGIGIATGIDLPMGVVKNPVYSESAANP
ncbi:hypothetical protein B484DRAFT_483152 [Ochromonadaceae sp. CCMP2298]|nr:hypothetical protein B484DRAFT_483152 [Ochromonadaceae sp. CCMP2298]